MTVENRVIYLDNNATTPVDPEVSDAIFSSLKRDSGNPSSGHLPGRKARAAVEDARQAIAEFLGCTAKEIVFTSGGTESNNLAILGTAGLYGKGHIITSCIEHPSVADPCRHLESLGFSITYAPVDAQGMVRVDEIDASIREDTFLISVMHSNNETGVLQPVEAVGALARKRGITFHVDAAQSVGKMFFELKDSAIDLLTVVSHKFYGPKGVGVLRLREGLKIGPLFFGASHERGIRPGTENVAGIVGLQKACEIAARDMKLRVAHTSRLRNMLLRGLIESLPGTALNGGDRDRLLPNTLSVRIPGIRGHELVERLGENVAISAGSACHSGMPVASSVLKNMGLSDEEAISTVRISIGKDNTEEEITRALELIVGAVKALRGPA